MSMCKIEDCDSKRVGRGLCDKHYRRLRRRDNTDVDVNWNAHGMSRSPEYNAWRNMKSRCYDANRPDHKNYGGRGISVCSEWKSSFLNFYRDMGARPEGATLDRIDVDGDYEKGNCRWVSWEVQANNQRLRQDNKSGVKGVFWNRERQKWEVLHKGRRMAANPNKEFAVIIKRALQRLDARQSHRGISL